MGCVLRSLLLLALWVVSLGVVIVYAADSERQKFAFDAAPGCSGALHASTVPAPAGGCSDHMATVADHWVVTHTYHHGHGRVTTIQGRYLAFAIGDGAVSSVRMPDDTFWNHVSTGDHVTVRLWHGHVTDVAGNGLAAQTGDSPEYAAESTLIFLPVFLGISLVIAVILGFDLHRALRRRAMISPAVRE